MSKVFIQQPLLPHYRAPFFERLANASPTLTFYLTYDSCPSKGFIPVKPLSRNILHLHSTWIFRYGIVWNFSLLRYVLHQYDLYIFNDNVRSPALYIFLLINFLLRRRSLLWGHGLGTTHPVYGLVLRRVLLFFANGYISYNTEGATLLKQYFPDKAIYTASNSLDTCLYSRSLNVPYSQLFTQTDLYKFNNSDAVLVYASRLEPEKHPFKLLDLISSLHSLDYKATLIVIGDGSLLQDFQKKVSDCPILKSSVFIVGSITDPNKLSTIFSLADFLVHPGVIGLTLQMSFCFSTPVITSINVKHMPEFTMFKNNHNGFLADFDNPSSLALKIKNSLSDPILYSRMCTNCYDTIYSRDGFNIERFISEFKSAISLSLSR